MQTCICTSSAISKILSVDTEKTLLTVQSLKSPQQASIFDTNFHFLFLTLHFLSISSTANIKCNVMLLLYCYDMTWCQTHKQLYFYHIKYTFQPHILTYWMKSYVLECTWNASQWKVLTLVLKFTALQSNVQWKIWYEQIHFIQFHEN